MNLCRTCKNWTVNANAIGLGTCSSTNVFMTTFPGGFRTAQNFGCIFHDEGPPNAKFFSDEYAQQMIDQFLASRKEQAK